MKLIPTNTSSDEPQGAPFVIDQCDFRFGEQVDVFSLSLEEDKVTNWPMIYILANDEDAYVGQTTSFVTRISQHGATEEKRDFTRVSIIFNEEFNTSVTTDFEHRLIGLMHADGKYRLTNKNEGMSDSNYFSKSKYSKMFDDLWRDLHRLELTEHSIKQIEESEVFKYSPYKGLTPDQRVALEKIYDAIENGLENATPIVVEGMPGTGKTVLAIYLLKALKDNPKYRDLNIRLLEPVTSLRNTLKKSLKNVSGVIPEDIIGPADLVRKEYGFSEGKTKSFDIVLIDESHRLKQRVNLGTQYGNYDKANSTLALPKEATQLDWILNQVRLPVFFYDPMQSVGPSCIGQDTIASSLNKATEEPIKLDSQMRVKGGKDYLDYIANILAGKDPEVRSFEGYDLHFHEDIHSFKESFDNTLSNHSLSRMIAGYAWKWNSKDSKDPCSFDIEIDNVRLRWNVTYDNWVVKGMEDPNVAKEVGCIHSIQGYDLSYAYVIIGRDLCINQENGKLEADRKNYYDRNGYATASSDELTQYVKNIYYVLLTRGIYGTHVYVVDPALREYLSKYF